MIGSWRKLLLPRVEQQLPVEQPIHDVIHGIVDMAWNVSGEDFFDVEDAEVLKLVGAQNEALPAKKIEVILDQPEESEEAHDSQP